MQIDLKGRVSNFPLRPSTPLIPLFESIVNSIHSIWERNEYDKSDWNPYIDIKVIRFENQVTANNDRSLMPIEGFIIEDNGIGFIEKNFHAFSTSDTTSKLKLGGKGVGRFTWLKAFSQVSIESFYTENNQHYHRAFDFCLEGDGICDNKLDTIDVIQNKTIIKLNGYRKEFQNHCPKRLDKIASKIIEHCLSFFVLGNCPRIRVIDDNESIDLFNTYKNEIDPSIKSVSFSIGTESFEVKHIKIYSAEALAHRIHLCAHNREVFDTPIQRLPDLSKRLKDENGKEFSYSAYVSGNYFDMTVDESRTGFIGNQKFDGSGQEKILSPGEISWKQISDYIHMEIENYLSPYLNPIRTQKIHKIENYIQTEAPQYRHLLKRCKDEIALISPDEIEGKKLDLALYKIKQNAEYKTKETVREIFEDHISRIMDTNEYEERVSQILTVVSEESQAALSQYIVHRKTILKLLEKWIEIQPTGKYSKEDKIHELIIPMRTDSEEIDYNSHNLWLVDERLSYHYFLSSDKEIKTNKPIESESDNRTDLIVYNNIYDKAMAFTDERPPYGSITILEFKRPERNDYNEENNNPIEQVIKYVEDILESKCFTKNRRRIEVPKTTPFYCYIICDISPKLKSIAMKRDFKFTPDNMGLFYYLSNMNAYIEIISYDKLLKDAKQRNQVLFDKLNI